MIARTFPARSAARSRALVACVVACVIAWSCHDSPTAPILRQPARVVTVGQEIEGSLTAAQPTTVLTLTGHRGDELAITFAISDGAAEVLLTDSLELRTLASAQVTVRTAAPTWTVATSGSVVLPSDGSYRLRVQMLTGWSLKLDYTVATTVVRRTPEQISASVGVNDTISGESIGNAADVDEFDVHVGGPLLTTAFLRNSGSGGVAVDMVVLDESTGSLLGAVSAHPGVSTLDANASGRFRFPRAGTYRVRVRARARVAPAGTFPVPYAFQLFAVDTIPERHARTIAPNDTVGDEALAPLGDVDEFALAGTAGQQYNIFLRGSNGVAGDSLLAYFVDATGTRVGGIARSSGTDATLLGHATGRVTLPASGTYRLVVRGASDTTSGYRGSYGLFLYPVNDAPESVAPSLPADGRVDSEAIDLPGDVDTYSFSVGTPTLVNVELHHASAAADSVRAVIVDGSGRQAVVVAVAPTEGRGSGVAALAPGAYRLVVAGAKSDGRGFAGAYSLRLHRLAGTGPESIAASMAIGDTVTEALSPLGDVDVFTFQAKRGDHLHLHLQRLAGSGGMFQAVVRGSSNGQIIGRVDSWSDQGTLENRSPRLTIPERGDYTITVSPVNAGVDVADQGPYRLALLRVADSPEHVSATIAVGDSITAERFDMPGDIDRFILTGTPNQEVVLYMSGPPGACTHYEVSDTTERMTLANGLSCGYFQLTPRFRLPASGVVAIDALEYLYCDYFFGCSEYFAATGPFFLRVVAIDRAPESTGASLAYGDSVTGRIGEGWTRSGEFIDPGDVDEYTFVGTAGDSVEVVLRTPNGVWSIGGIRLDVLDASSGAVLATTIGTNPDDVTTGMFVLPASGTYVIRVNAVDQTNADPTYGSGPYGLLLRRIGGS